MINFQTNQYYYLCIYNVNTTLELHYHKTVQICVFSSVQ